MGSTQSISRTIHPIAMKRSKNIANILTCFEPRIKISRDLSGHFGGHIENMKNALCKKDKTSIGPHQVLKIRIYSEMLFHQKLIKL